MHEQLHMPPIPTDPTESSEGVTDWVYGPNEDWWAGRGACTPD